MTTMKRQKLMLRACPRCQGDLLFDSYEEDFVCLQCGRHASTSAVLSANSGTEAVTSTSVSKEPALAA